MLTDCNRIWSATQCGKVADTDVQQSVMVWGLRSLTPSGNLPLCTVHLYGLRIFTCSQSFD